MKAQLVKANPSDEITAKVEAELDRVFKPIDSTQFPYYDRFARTLDSIVSDMASKGSDIDYYVVQEQFEQLLKVWCDNNYYTLQPDEVYATRRSEIRAELLAEISESSEV